MKAVKMQKNLIWFLCLIVIVSATTIVFGFNVNVARAEQSSIFSFAQTSETECNVRLIDKTVTKAYIPEKAIIDGAEYTVTSIANNGFSSATKLTKVRLPKSIKTIGTSAFANCKELRSITLPAVEEINASAFNLCAKLDNIILPRTVRSVASTVFKNAPVTVHVRISESDTANWAANWNIVTGTQTTTTIYNSEYVPTIEYKKISGTPIEQSIETYGLVNGEYYIVDEWQPFNEEREEGTEGTYVYIPAEYQGPGDEKPHPVRGIAANAFEYNDIDTLVIGYSEEPINIESSAFTGLNGTKIIINRDVTFNDVIINDKEEEEIVSVGVFADSQVNTIVLPNTISEIGAHAFNSCGFLSSIYFITPSLLSKENEEKLDKGKTEGRVELPATENFYKIGDEVFAGAVSITEIIIPENIREMGKMVFQGWQKGQEITIFYQEEAELPWDEETETGWNPKWKNGCAQEIIFFQGEFQITYNLNGGTHSGNPDIYNSKDNIILNPATRNGYTFGGWYDNVEFLGEAIASIPQGSSGDKEFHAKWIANKYTIKYNENKPSKTDNEVKGKMQDSTHEYDIESLLSENLYKLEGYNFIGWNTEPNGSGISYADENKVINLSNIDGDEIELYAIWKDINYEIEYNRNKPSNATGVLDGDMANTSHTYDSDGNLAENAYSLVGWKFIAWNTKFDGSGEEYANQANIINLSNQDGDVVVLYAQWKAIKYTVMFNKNKPPKASAQIDGSMDDMLFDYDNSRQLAGNRYSLVGWEFVGWNTKDEGTGKSYFDGESVKNLIEYDGMIVTLYAQWKAYEYTVEYEPNQPSKASNEVIGEPYSSPHNYDDTDSKLKKNEFSLVGWHFIGWNTKADGTGIPYYNQGAAYNLSLVNHGKMTLYAQWEANEYIVSYEPNKPDKATHEVLGDTNPTTHTYESFALLAKNKFTLEGWHFVGWSLKDNGDVVYYDMDSVKNMTTAENVALYAIWERNEYTVEYKPNKPSEASHNVVGETYVSTHFYDEESQLNRNGFSLTGWHFIGWNTEANGTGTAYSVQGIAYNLPWQHRQNPVKLYAQWEANEYTVTYEQNTPAKATNIVLGNMNPTVHTYDFPSHLAKNEYTLEGWHFVGWALNDNGNASHYDMEIVKTLPDDNNGSENIILFAIWEPNEYYVRYNDSGNMPMSVHAYDQVSYLNKNTYNVSGKRFMGWATRTGGSVVYNDGASIFNLSNIEGEIIDLYPKREDIYTITVDGTEGYGGYFNDPVYKGDPYGILTYTGIKNEVICIPRIMMDGYYFTWEEWRNDKKYDDYVVGCRPNSKEIKYTIEGDATLIAQKRLTTIDESSEIYAAEQLMQLQKHTFKDNDFFRIYNSITVENWTPIQGFRGYLSAGSRTDSDISKVTITIKSFSGYYENMGFIGTNINGSINRINFNATFDTKSSTVKNVGVVIGRNQTSRCYLMDCTVSGKITCYKGQNYGDDIYADIHGRGIVGVSSAGAIGSEVKNNVSVEVKSECIVDGTLITLADGIQVPVETLTGNEMLLVWNLRTGKFDVAPILFMDKDPASMYEVVHLYFSDGTDVSIIYEHAFFDITLNKYVFFGNDNLGTDYIGHWFNKQITDANGDLSWTKVQLTNVIRENIYTRAWSPVTYDHLCYYVNGMLSMPGGVSKLVNIFSVDGEIMQYDQDAFAADLEQYGEFTYEEFSEKLPVSETVFEAFGGRYLKVAMGKGLVTWEDLQELVERYSGFFAEL